MQHSTSRTTPTTHARTHWSLNVIWLAGPRSPGSPSRDAFGDFRGDPKLTLMRGPKLTLMRGMRGTALLKSAAASLNSSKRFTRRSADWRRACRPSFLYPARALSWMRPRPSRRRFASTGISLALSASEMSIRLSTSRATERSALRRAALVPSSPSSPAPPAPSARLSPGRDPPGPPGNAPNVVLVFARFAKPPALEEGTSRLRSIDPRLCDVGFMLERRFWMATATSAGSAASAAGGGSASSSEASSCAFQSSSRAGAPDPSRAPCTLTSSPMAPIAGAAKSVADRRAWPLLGGIDSRRAAPAAPRGAKGSAAMARDSATCSSPVSVVLGVVPGVVTGVDPGETPSSAPSASSPSKPSTPRSAIPESSLRRRLPCIALSVWPCSSKSSAAASTLPSRLRRGPGGRFPLPLIAAEDGDGRSRQAVAPGGASAVVASPSRRPRRIRGSRESLGCLRVKFGSRATARRGGDRAVKGRFVARARDSA